MLGHVMYRGKGGKERKGKEVPRLRSLVFVLSSYLHDKIDDFFVVKGYVACRPHHPTPLQYPTQLKSNKDGAKTVRP